MSETAEMSMSRVPAFTFLVSSLSSSTRTDRSCAPKMIIWLSMHRSASEKFVTERNGACWGPVRTWFAVSRTSFFVSIAPQPANAAAAAAMSQVPILFIPCVARIMPPPSSPVGCCRCSLALVVRIDHVALYDHDDLFRGVARAGVDRVPYIHVAGGVALVLLVLALRLAGGVAFRARPRQLRQRPLVHVERLGADRVRGRRGEEIPNDEGCNQESGLHRCFPRGPRGSLTMPAGHG